MFCLLALTEFVGHSVVTKPVFEVNLKSMIARAAERRKIGQIVPKPPESD
jgi:hypothetical protein